MANLGAYSIDELAAFEHSRHRYKEEYEHTSSLKYVLVDRGRFTPAENSWSFDYCGSTGNGRLESSRSFRYLSHMIETYKQHGNNKNFVQYLYHRSVKRTESGLGPGLNLQPIRSSYNAIMYCINRRRRTTRCVDYASGPMSLPNYYIPNYKNTTTFYSGYAANAVTACKYMWLANLHTDAAPVGTDTFEMIDEGPDMIMGAVGWLRQGKATIAEGINQMRNSGDGSLLSKIQEIHATAMRTIGYDPRVDQALTASGLPDNVTNEVLKERRKEYRKAISGKIVAFNLGVAPSIAGLIDLMSISSVIQERFNKIRRLLEGGTVSANVIYVNAHKPANAWTYWTELNNNNYVLSSVNGTERYWLSTVDYNAVTTATVKAIPNSMWKDDPDFWMLLNAYAEHFGWFDPVLSKVQGLPFSWLLGTVVPYENQLLSRHMDPFCSYDILEHTFFSSIKTINRWSIATAEGIDKGPIVYEDTVYRRTNGQLTDQIMYYQRLPSSGGLAITVGALGYAISK